MNYQKMLKRIGAFGLSAMMVATMMPQSAITAWANEVNPLSVDADGYTHLEGVSVDTEDGNIVTLNYVSGEKAKITFLRDNMFRFNVEPTGKFQDYPTPNSTSHKATIVAQPDEDTSVYTHPTPAVNDDADTITISTGSLALTIDKASAKMKLTNTENNTVVWEEEDSIKYKRNETIQTLKTDNDENIFGGGVQHGRFTHKGTSLNIAPGGWDDGGSSSPSPFYWSTNGYGILRNTWKPGTYDFGETYDNKIVTKHNEQRFDSYFFVDDQPLELINDYEDITGHAEQLPEYAFYLGTLNCYNRDYWDTQRNYKDGFKNPTDDAHKDDPKYPEYSSTGGSGNRYLYKDGTQYFERQPAKWGAYSPNNGEYIQEKIAESEIQETLLSTEENTKFSAQRVIEDHEAADIPMAWFLPNDGYGCGYGQTDSFQGDLDNLRQFTEYANAHGVQSGLWTQSNLWPSDPSNPQKGERDVTKEVNEAGIRSIKTDVAWVGSGYSMALNGISVAHEAISESGARPNIVTLMGWAGTQRYGGIWTGDQNGGVWEYIRFHIPTYIGAGLSGQPNMSSDMDGIYSGGDPIITTRDYQWKSFTPQMLDMDGWGSKQKFPYTDDNKGDYTSINRAYLKLKAELMPYINEIAWEAATTSNPMIRAMLLDYPNEPHVYDKTTQYQYMWGDSFLVAPIYQNTSADAAGNDVRNGIYLPDENQVWIDYFTGEQYNGGQIINDFEAPLWKLPLFVKNGAIIPMYPENNNPGEISKENKKGLDKTQRIVEFYPSGSTSYETYEDDGMSNNNVENHVTSTITSVVDEAAKTATLTAGKTKGSYDGYDPRRSTEFIVNVSKAPTAVTGNVNGSDVTFTEVADKAAYDAATGNVWYYDEHPESGLNKYADEGVSFNVETSPKVFVKSTDKVSISANEFTVVVEGFENDGNLPSTGENSALSAPTFTDPELEFNAITVNWAEVADATTYDIEADGVVYTMNKNTNFLHNKLASDSVHTYRVRAVNHDGHSAWSDPIEYRTKLDPLRNVAKDMTVKYLDGAVPSAYAGKLEYIVDGQDKTEYSSLNSGEWTNKSFSIDMNKIYSLEKLEYLFRQNGGNGAVSNFALSYSLDGSNWFQMDDWNIKFADWPTDETGTYKTAALEFAEPLEARYLKFTVKKSSGGFFQCYEIRPYHVDGDAGKLLGDIDGNGIIDSADELTLRQHFALPGLHEGDDAWANVSRFKTDYNQNGIFDVYDTSTLLTQLNGGVTTATTSVDGSMFVRPSVQNVKAGETFTVDVLGAGMSAVNGFDFELAFEQGSIDSASIAIEAGDIFSGMNNYSKTMDRNNKTMIYSTYVNSGQRSTINGNGVLATVTLKAEKDMDLSDVNVTHAMIVSNGLASKTLDVITLNSEEANPTYQSTITMIQNLGNNTQYPKTFKTEAGMDVWQSSHGIDKLFDGGVADAKSFDSKYDNGAEMPYTFTMDFMNEDGSEAVTKNLYEIVLYYRIKNGNGVDAGELLPGESLTPEGNYEATMRGNDQVKKAQLILKTADGDIDCGIVDYAKEKLIKIQVPVEYQTKAVTGFELIFKESYGGAYRLNIAEMQVYEIDPSNVATGVAFDESNPATVNSGESVDVKAMVTPTTAINQFLTMTSDMPEVLKVVRKVVDGSVVFELQAAEGISEETTVTLTATTLDGIESTSKIIVKANAEVNKDSLLKLYNDNKNKNADLYTTSTWNEFATALANAKAVLNNDAATAENVAEAENALTVKLTALEKRADEWLLVQLDEEATAYAALQEDYTEEEFAEMLAALNAAEAILAKAPADVSMKEARDASIAMIMAASNLGKFEISETLLANLKGVIKIANATLNSDEIADVRPGKVQALIDAVAVGQALVDENSTERLKIKDSITAITKASQELWLIIDKAPLESLIASGTEKLTGNYTAETKEALTNALAQAEAALSDDATTDQVKNAYNALAEAIINLKPMANKDALEKQIEIAEKVIANIDDYISSTVAGLADLLNEAKDVYDNKDATQASVDEITEALTKANLKARTKADKTALIDAINEANTIDLDQYTSASATKVRVALMNAEQVMTDEAATEAAVKAATDAIYAAIDGLQKATDVTPGDDGNDDNQGGNDVDNTNKPSTDINNGNGGAGNNTPNNGANTGDATNAGALLGLLAISGCAALAMAKKRKEEE